MGEKKGDTIKYRVGKMSRFNLKELRKEQRHNGHDLLILQ